jgi:S-adenosylmethionine hydrolase
MLPDVSVVDINHHIQRFNIAQAAFVLRHSYLNFPKSTVHLIGVNSESTDDNPHIVILYKGHYFIGADNGIFGLLFDDAPEEIVRLNKNINCTFPELSIFADAAVHLIRGGKMSELGIVTDSYYKKTSMLATIDTNVITGSIIYIDSYMNAITNISKELFERIGNGRPFEISVQTNHYKIKKINKMYYESSVGELLAIFNSLDLIEIAMNKGNVAELLGLNLNSVVRIKFFDKNSQKGSIDLLSNFVT